MTFVYPLEAEVAPELRVRLLGRKSAGLQEMIALGIPVPPGFTIATDVGAELRRTGRWPKGLEPEVDRALLALERSSRRGFGEPENPLLLSVRSGAAVSMPGMLDTILNVGLNDDTVEGLAVRYQDERFALDSYRRLLHMYGGVVRGIAPDRFEFRLQELKSRIGHPRVSDSELEASALRSLIDDYKSLIEEASESPFPQNVRTQLWDAVRAVFASWDNRRAVRYRRMQAIDGAIGTACTVQAMVFGNVGPMSGSGVAFTRNPSSGEKRLYGEYLSGAQGEDIVAGTRTPAPLAAADALPGRESVTLERALPAAFDAVRAHCGKLEHHFRDVQDVEFTVEDGKTYVLQTRAAKRTARAAVRIAVDMVREGVLSRDDALTRVDARSLRQLIKARLPSATDLAERGIEPAAVGLPASPGAASGRIVFDADDAVRWALEGQEVILVRRETSSEDVHGVKVAKGVVTAAGGMTSHAAVVARGLGRCCVVGCDGLRVDPEQRTVRIKNAPANAPVFREGDLLTLDGSTGRVYSGALDLEASNTVAELSELMQWADERRRLRVVAEADTPQQARAALSYGAEGVGLCRTERMFFDPDRLFATRCALMAPDGERRTRYLDELEVAQRADFMELFEAMEGRPITVRLLDRASEEVMPDDADAVAAIAKALDVEADEMGAALGGQLETNPAFGHRGVRAGLTFPGVYQMQLRAMMGAARDCVDRGVPVELEIMVPMVAFAAEVAKLAKTLGGVRDGVFDRPTPAFSCRLGALIEIPRACLIAGELAAHVDFFSFGCDDLTQTVLGVSREDASQFLPKYRNELALLAYDPFAVLDPGVLELMRIALERGRAVKPTLAAGLSGDHGRHLATIEACDALGLDFVSTPLSDLAGVRLAAAQARIR